MFFCDGLHYNINEDDELVSLCVFVKTKRLLAITQLRGNYIHNIYNLIDLIFIFLINQ